MEKKLALAILFKCAYEYQRNLEGENVLFIFGTQKTTSHFEAEFLGRNFMHLTGIELKQNRFKSSTDFYKACIDKRISASDFDFTKNGTTEMKLSVLPQMMTIYKCVKSVGEYNFSKSMLRTEKIAGNVTACMGFIREDNYYIPNTVLKENIGDITINPQQRILAVLKKPIGNETYNHLCYLAKGISIDTLTLPAEIERMVDRQHLTLESGVALASNKAIAAPPQNAIAVHGVPTDKLTIRDRLSAAKAQVAERDEDKATHAPERQPKSDKER